MGLSPRINFREEFWKQFKKSGCANKIEMAHDHLLLGMMTRVFSNKEEVRDWIGRVSWIGISREYQIVAF